LCRKGTGAGRANTGGSTGDNNGFMLEEIVIFILSTPSKES
jgi:hypothetical protein